jgi:uncharacterized protein
MTDSITGTTAAEGAPRGAVTFTSFLIKVASRCNLACDYCYVYEHADQTWRDQPRLMSSATVEALAQRIAEYVVAGSIDRILLVFHGGEPLLFGADRLAATARLIRDAVPKGVEVDCSLQTNGLLLKEQALATLEAADIGISLSIDGPRDAQDLHRRTARGKSSFDGTVEALRLLERHPQVFSGIIAVVDTAVVPVELFRFFSDFVIPRLDFLLPDANHDRPPAGRELEPDRYLWWLVEAFDLWFDAYSDLPVRTFDAVLAGVAGLPSNTDAFGFGDVSLLTIETDGTYHDLDVLKITESGRTATGLGVDNAPLAAAAMSDVILEHQRLLQPSGLASECQRCPERDICGGGSIPHRFGSGTFNHPTVYCREMLALIKHARERVREAISVTSAQRRTPARRLDLSRFDLAESSDGGRRPRRLSRSGRQDRPHS